MAIDVSKTSERIERLADLMTSACRTAARSDDATARKYAVKRAELCLYNIKRMIEREERAGHGAELEAELSKRGLLT